MAIIWCIVPEIWSATDRTFCRSGLFFALLPPYGPIKSKFWQNDKNTWRDHHFMNVYHKWESSDVCFLRYGVQQTEFFIILDNFLPFYPPLPPNNPKNLNFQKMKEKKKTKTKKTGDIIILHICSINDNHMMCGSWDMKHDRQNFFAILEHFLRFYLPNNPKN